MSNAAQSWAWSQTLKLASDKFVLVALADNAWEDGSHAWPSLDTLAAKTNLSRRTVYAALGRLETAGYIRKDQEPKQHKPAVYSLIYDRPRDAVVAPVQPLHPCNPRHPEVQLTASRGAAVAPEPSLTLKEPSTKKTRMPATFVIDDDLKAWAKDKAPSIDLHDQTERWLEHHRAAGSQFVDWRAAWRKWMRNAEDWRTPGSSRGSPARSGHRPFVNPSDQSVYDEPLEAS